jgi:hypothetical protein
VSDPTQRSPLAALERLVADLERARRRAAAEVPYSPAWAAIIEEVEELERRAVILGSVVGRYPSAQGDPPPA